MTFSDGRGARAGGLAVAGAPVVASGDAAAALMRQAIASTRRLKEAAVLAAPLVIPDGALSIAFP